MWGGGRRWWSEWWVFITCFGRRYTDQNLPYYVRHFSILPYCKIWKWHGEFLDLSMGLCNMLGAGTILYVGNMQDAACPDLGARDRKNSSAASESAGNLSSSIKTSLLLLWIPWIVVRRRMMCGYHSLPTTPRHTSWNFPLSCHIPHYVAWCKHVIWDKRGEFQPLKVLQTCSVPPNAYLGNAHIKSVFYTTDASNYSPQDEKSWKSFQQSMCRPKCNSLFTPRNPWQGFVGVKWTGYNLV